MHIMIYSFTLQRQKNLIYQDHPTIPKARFLHCFYFRLVILRIMQYLAPAYWNHMKTYPKQWNQMILYLKLQDYYAPRTRKRKKYQKRSV